MFRMVKRRAEVEMVLGGETGTITQVYFLFPISMSSKLINGMINNPILVIVSLRVTSASSNFTSRQWPLCFELKSDQMSVSTQPCPASGVTHVEFQRQCARRDPVAGEGV